MLISTLQCVLLISDPAGLMLNKISFTWKALGSCDNFVSFLDNLLATDGLLPEEKAERMPLLLARSSLAR